MLASSICSALIRGVDRGVDVYGWVEVNTFWLSMTLNAKTFIEGGK